MFEFLFGSSKPDATATAEVLVHGRDAMNETLKSPRYNDYKGAEPMVEVAVRVTDDAGKTWDATMEAGLTVVFLLVPGMKVDVKYASKKPARVFLASTQDELMAAAPPRKP
jgi:hypothetical protein